MTAADITAVVTAVVTAVIATASLVVTAGTVTPRRGFLSVTGGDLIEAMEAMVITAIVGIAGIMVAIMVTGAMAVAVTTAITKNRLDD